MNQTPLFSVIIPTYHRNDLLAKCLDCLAPGVQTLPAEQYEVIVTDDGSQTTAEEMIRQQYPWANWVAGPRKGPAANRNNGAKYAQGEWLAFTDDDCLPVLGWLSAFAKATNGNAKALEGAIHPLGNLDQDLAECPVNMTGGCFWSANIAVQRGLFETIGGFDANYSLAAHEDQDLKLRLDTITIITFVADAYVFHPVRLISLKQAIFRVPNSCMAWAYHTSKNKDFLSYKSNLDFILAGYHFQTRNLIKSLLKGKIKAAIISFTVLVIGLPLVSKHYLLSSK
jgi:glycosyltransferase involved in cell wall biosynthesis